MRLLERSLSPSTTLANCSASSNKIVPLATIAPQDLWRTTPAGHCSQSDIGRIRGLLQDVAILGDPRWREAASGDPAAAIGIAMGICDPEDGPSPLLDLVMSALFACVIEGDPAARLVFGNLVRRADWLDHVEVEPVDLVRLMTEGLPRRRAGS